MNKKVFIILLNYKGVKDTIECIRSLESITYSNYEVVIVDNLSPDNSYETLKNIVGHRHHVISSGRNGGFAFGNNVGIKYALEKNAEYILLLNNDTIVEKDFLEPLVNTLENSKEIALATGLILNYYKKDIIWYAGGEIDWKRFYGYHINENKKITKDDLIEKEITFATGCLMLIRAEVLNEIGLLPEEYFMYYEDVDYCSTLIKNNYKIYYNPKSIIYHKISASSGDVESPFAIEWNTRNRLRFINKNKEYIGKVKYFKGKVFFLTTRIIKIIQYLIKGRKDKIISLIRGVTDKK